MSWLNDAWDTVTDTAAGWAGDALGWSPDTRHGVTTWLQGAGPQILQWGAGAVSKVVGGGSSGLPPGAQALINQQVQVQKQLQSWMPFLQKYAAQRRMPLQLLVEMVRRALLAKSARPQDREGVLRSGAPPGFSQTPTSAAGNAVDDVSRLMGLATGKSDLQRFIEARQRMPVFR